MYNKGTTSSEVVFLFCINIANLAQNRNGEYIMNQQEIQRKIKALNRLGYSFRYIAKKSNLQKMTIIALANNNNFKPHDLTLSRAKNGINQIIDDFKRELEI
jgi:hypothetical protein